MKAAILEGFSPSSLLVPAPVTRSGRPCLHRYHDFGSVAFEV
jgi:hypothetical protein